MNIGLINSIGRRKGGGINYNALGLVTEAYKFNNAATVQKIYYKKTGTAYSLSAFVPTNEKLSEYSLIADDGGFIKNNGCSVGDKTTTYVIDSYNNFDSRTGAWTTSPPNYFTREIGATMTFSFTGTGINFYCIGRSDMCGLWGFKIDGGDEIILSTYRATTGYLNQIIARGLTDSQHTIIGTYKGEDPAHPGGTPTGWCYYGNETTTGCFHVYRSEFGYTKDSQLIAANSLIEMAMQPKREGATYTPEWFPYHNPVTMTPISRLVKIDGVEVASWAADTNLKECTKIEIWATYNTFNSSEPDQLLNRIVIYQKVDKYGYEFNPTITSLQNQYIDKYSYMLTVDRTFATLLTDNLGHTYDMTKMDDVITNITDGDSIRQFKVTSNLAGKTNYQICTAFVNTGALRIGASDRGYANTPYSLFVINNLSYDTVKNKIYCSTFRNHYFPAGEVFSCKNIYYIGMI